jgi:hypothetical protein
VRRRRLQSNHNSGAARCDLGPDDDGAPISHDNHSPADLYNHDRDLYNHDHCRPTGDDVDLGDTRSR